MSPFAPVAPPGRIAPGHRPPTELILNELKNLFTPPCPDAKSLPRGDLSRCARTRDIHPEEISFSSPQAGRRPATGEPLGSWPCPLGFGPGAWELRLSPTCMFQKAPQTGGRFADFLEKLRSAVRRKDLRRSFFGTFLGRMRAGVSGGRCRRQTHFAVFMNS